MRDIYGVLKFQRDVLDSGNELLRYYDTQNRSPQAQRTVARNAAGRVTAVDIQLDQNILAAGGSIGQVFGSAIGRAIAGDNQFAQLAAGTVAGAIGQAFGTALSASLTTNLSHIGLGAAFSNFGVSLQGAGAGSIASFLTAELGTALGLSGFGAQLFNATVGTYAGSIASQVATQGFGVLSSGSALWSNAFNSSITSVGGAVGSLLASQIYQAQTQIGAIGGQLGGAIGGIIGSAVIGNVLGTVLNFVVPGIGSLIGSLLGSLLGDLFGGTDHPAAGHIVQLSGNSYTSSFFFSEDGGDVNVSGQMAQAVGSIVNAYLSAVNGAAVNHGSQSSVGFNTQVSSTPYFGGTYIAPTGSVGGTKAEGTTLPSYYATAEEAVAAAANFLLHNTEVIGGDLLLKRAHQRSTYSDTVTLGGDLQVAQDYSRYLNDRETINALIAAYPNSAFTAGWAATFARVRDLGLDVSHASDFHGGLVGFLDSVRKAGLATDASSISVARSGAGVTVTMRMPRGVDIPGVLSVYAPQVIESNDASGRTLQFLFAASQFTGTPGNNLWFGYDHVSNVYSDTSPNSHDILVGGASPDSIAGGNGWDFIQGGEGGDDLRGGIGNDIVHGDAGDDSVNGDDGDDRVSGGAGRDTINGGAGNDTVVFSGARGDYLIAYRPADGIYTVADLRAGSPDGTDSVAETEFFAFTDQTLAAQNVRSPITALIETAGLTSLVTVGGNYVFYASGFGPSLKNGTAVAVVPQGGWAPIAVEKTASGYQVAWRAGNTHQYSVWTTDNSGNVTSDTGVLSGSSATFQAYEGGFHQDLNSDGVFGVVTRVIEASGSTSLVQVGDNYFFHTGGSGPSLKNGGVAVVAGPPGSWAPIAVEKTASGYQVAWRAGSTHQYSVWTTDSNGNVTSDTGELSGSSITFQAYEASFHQDLNGDGVIGVVNRVIETAGSTSLVEAGNNYFFHTGGSGPSLKNGGVAVVAGPPGSWAPISVEKTARGYQVAWRAGSTDQYSIWTTDSNGNFTSDTGVLLGSSARFQAYESNLHQDLNGDGVISGDDTYFVHSPSDVVTENADQGNDTIWTSVTYTLPENVEILALLPGPAIDGTGNSAANFLFGNMNNNVLNGAAGADYMNGAAGDDKYFVDNAGDLVIENADQGNDTIWTSVTYTLPENVEILALLPGPAIDGTGNSAANFLFGNMNNNVLNGAAGADYMNGAAGDDKYFVDNAGDLVIENADQGNDTIWTSVTYTLPENVEILALLPGPAIDGTGNSAANFLFGNMNNNVLNGAAGADYMNGAAGDDKYFVDNAGDLVIENADQGNDTIWTSVTYTLPENVEILKLLPGERLNGTGNSADNVITGNDSSNVLAGLGGNDILDGGAGNDTLIGGAGNNSYIFNTGYDHDLIDNHSVDGINAANGSIEFGLSRSQLWFDRNGNDLDIRILGTQDRLTIEGWYADSDSQVAVMTAAGYEMSNSSIAQLVTAMATFESDYAANHEGATFNPTSGQNTVITDVAVLAAINTTWHQISA